MSDHSPHCLVGLPTTDDTDEPVCPHCFYPNPNAHELDFGPGLDGDTVSACPHCGKDYKVERQVTVTFTTSIL